MQDPNFVIPLLDHKYTDGIKRKILDISYCHSSQSQKLDIYFPNEKKHDLYPVIVYFHGGAFMIGTRKDDALEPMLRALEEGYVVVSADYRLSKEARFPAMLYDAKTVIRFIRSKAKEFEFDADRIAVWGPSSGGWLVSMLNVTFNNQGMEDLSYGYEEYSSRVNAEIDWCGPCGGFDKMDDYFKKSHLGIADHNDPNSPESLFLGSPLERVKELCRLSSPITYISKDMAPVCIFHGSIDQVVPVEMSIDFANAIKEKAGENKIELHIEKAKLHHGNPWYHERYVSDACLSFLNKVFYQKS